VKAGITSVVNVVMPS